MRLEEVQAGGGGALGALARGGLRVLAVGWGGISGIDRLLYDSGIRRPLRLAVPVVSVGNLVAGGTGKTPFVAWLAQQLLSRKHQPGILSRGYGPHAAGSPLSDEGAVLERLLGEGVPQVEDPNRIRGADRLLAAHPATDVLLLDDGFQHRRVARDLDIVLLDATRPFGHGHLLPRGLLRERPTALRRADAVVITRTERVTRESADRLCEAVGGRTSAVIVRSRSRPAYLEVRGRLEPVTALQGRAVSACCGIGRPEAFAAMLAEDLGARVVHHRFLADHARSDLATWSAIVADAKRVGAEYVVITRKDAVKLERLPPEVVVLDIEIEVTDGESALLDLVSRAVGGV